MVGYDVYYEKGDEEIRSFFIEGIKKVVKLVFKYLVCLVFEIMDICFMGINIRVLIYINMINSLYL